MRFEHLEYENRQAMFQRLHKLLNKALFSGKLRRVSIDVENVNMVDDLEQGVDGVFRRPIEGSCAQKAAILFSREFADSLALEKTETDQIERLSLVLLHQMIHQYCWERRIVDDDHNDIWQDVAFTHGLDSIYIDGIKIEEDLAFPALAAIDDYDFRMY